MPSLIYIPQTHFPGMFLGMLGSNWRLMLNHLLFYTYPLLVVSETQMRMAYPAFDCDDMAQCQASSEVLDVWPNAIWEMASDVHLAFMRMLQNIVLVTGASYNSSLSLSLF